MKVEVRDDSIMIDGYVNAVERLSKPLFSPLGEFRELVKAGTFKRAIEANDNVKVLLDHEWDRELASTGDGTCSLEEDAIGLRARCEIRDAEVIEKAKDGKLRGWSFGFNSPEYDKSEMDGETIRSLKSLVLNEVSIIDDKKIPAYDGTIIYRENSAIELRAIDDEIEVVDNRTKPETKPEVKPEYDNSKFIAIVKRLEEENNEQE